jgi:myo-inositol 2-dehydrogenase / D-chiro-inositol 1-dehydrogenase
MSKPLGVGIIGAGPVTQAIHLPTISTLDDRLRVVHIMDVNAEVGASVARRSNARSSTDVQTLLDDPAVEVVAICSPGQFHAGQVEAATAAGKRAILCEKPLATTVQEAQLIADVSTKTGVPVVVGAMHVYDPAFVAVQQSWADLPNTAALVRVAAYLTHNDEMVDLATELTAAAPTPGSPPDVASPQVRASMVRAGVLGLATHNLPLVRHFLSSVDEVLAAEFVSPFGYQLTFRSGNRIAQLLALMPGQWRPDWSLRVWGREVELQVQFPPSYVLAGSATAELIRGTSRSSWRYAHNGYQAEWLHLADVAEGKSELAIGVQTAVDDLLYALALADGADALILGNQS